MKKIIGFLIIVIGSLGLILSSCNTQSGTGDGSSPPDSSELNKSATIDCTKRIQDARKIDTTGSQTESGTGDSTGGNQKKK
ncbi:MAG: hypothetical protein HXX13_07700 [Bacteroidetes bacterium]|nr:hypothetical protein [Bacteroidota bacterium]